MVDMNNGTQQSCNNVIQPGDSYTRLNEEPEKSSSMKQEVQISLWNSLESDTESLAQERMYQMELQNRIHQTNKMVNPSVEGATDRQVEQSGEEDEEDNEDDSKEDKIGEDNYIYDSLDVAAFRLGKRTTDDPEIHEIRKEDMIRHACGEDEYAALRYDPNWRNKLKGAQLFAEGRNQLSLEEEGPRVLVEPCDESPWEVGDHAGSGEQKNLSARRQAPSMGFVTGATTDHRSKSKLKLPPNSYYLSSRNDSASGAESPTSQCQRPLDRVEGAGSNRRPKAVPAARDRMHAGENQGISHEQEETYKEVNERYTKEYQLFYEQESSRTDETSNNSQGSAHHELKQHRRLSNTRPSKPKEDIVERNKITLGVRTNQGSYLCAHGQKDAKEHNDEQESEVLEEMSSISSQGSQGHLLDPELRWQQKTQRLKVYRKKKKGVREGNHQRPSPPITWTRAGDRSEGTNPSVLQDRCIGGGRGRRLQRGRTEGPVAGEADPGPDTVLSPSLLTPQSHPDHSPFTMKTPTLNLNISLNTSTDVAPFLKQDPRQASIKPSPHQGPSLGARPGAHNQTPMSCQYDYVVNPAQVAYYGPAYPPTVQQATLFSMVPTPNWVPGQQIQGRPFLHQGGRGKPSGVPLLWDHDNYSVQRMDLNCARIAPTKWQPAADKNLYVNPGDQHIGLQPQDSQRLSAQSSGSYTVLPPIGQTVASDSELSSVIKRSSSEGYLAQLEKQKQLKEKTYKAYTLKDYKTLKQDVKLGGLGPNYKVTEMKAEKIRRQKQYSNEVRDQNKNISRIPFLPARSRGGSDTREDEVPRRKALEYARSIPKPKPPTEQKNGEKAGKEAILHEHVQYMGHQDLSQLARLEMLQKRHEEEKQVVAHFKALRAF